MSIRYLKFSSTKCLVKLSELNIFFLTVTDIRFENVRVHGANQIFLPTFTLLLTSWPLIPIKFMSNSLFSKGSWISPFTITGSTGMLGIFTSIPCLSKRPSSSSNPTLSGKPSSCTIFSRTRKRRKPSNEICSSALIIIIIIIII